jgi:hypothetical protein
MMSMDTMSKMNFRFCGKTILCLPFITPEHKTMFSQAGILLAEIVAVRHISKLVISRFITSD